MCAPPKQLLEDLSGRRVRGYRAPSYSITKRSLWALDVLIEEGYEYDTSIFPIHHDRYGIPNAPRHVHVLRAADGTIVEVPGSTVRIGGVESADRRRRLFPPVAVRVDALGHRRVNAVERQPVVFYLHPWEVDPEQPRFQVSATTRIRHYTGLEVDAAAVRRGCWSSSGSRRSPRVLERDRRARVAASRRDAVGRCARRAMRSVSRHRQVVDATGADAAAWDAFVASHPDATGYHAWAWRRVFKNALGHDSIYLIARERGDDRRRRCRSCSSRAGVRPTLTSLAFLNYGGVVADSEAAAAALLTRRGDLARRVRCRHVELRHIGQALSGAAVPAAQSGDAAAARARHVGAARSQGPQPDSQGAEVRI